uniref:serine/threonine-protein kinase PCRK1-like n=1 Tax=Erigeron canadensis TaxID=72917 RepID=UPI001CB900AD|nr:serine/threonine-protein kinase PCRK1-like [Erigeron canadensis]
MVFHCRCFSVSFEENEDIEYETRTTHTKSTSTQTFYTACSDFNMSSVPNVHAKTSQLSKLTEVKQSNLRVFTVAELKAATKGFCRACKIGEGGFGSVYKGVIKSLDPPFDDIHVAVKYASGILQGHKEWETEVNVLGVVEHSNLVKLIGYCAEENCEGTQLLLVYEYMPNRSVRDHLSMKSETPLSWKMRLKVAQDAARGLTYLHEDMDFQIIFRDFKSSNILLDDQWNAKLSDFGLARLGPQEGLTHISTKFVGTMGYAAPEYLAIGHLTSKSDVWSYGVFLYELITGRRPVDRNRPLNEQKLLEWVKPYLESNNFQRIIDPRLEGAYSLKSAQRLFFIANCCLSRDPKLRPKMSEVLEMVNQLTVVLSQKTSREPRLKIMVPVIGIKWKKVVMGITIGKKTRKNTKNKDEKESIDIQLRSYAHLP